MKRDFPQRQGSQGYGTAQSQSSVGHARTQFVPSYPSAGQSNQYQSQGAAQALSTCRQAGEVRVWVEAGDRAYRLGLRGAKGLSMPLHHRLSL